MKTIKIKLYSFSELSEKAKQKVLNNLSDLNTEFNWYEFIEEEFLQKFKDSGFSATNAYFSGFSSQGDGAMFEYDGLDSEVMIPEFVATLKTLPEWKKKVLLGNALCSGTSRQSGHYYHEHSCSHNIYFESNVNDVACPNIANFTESYQSEFEEFIEEKYQALCREYYKALEKEYEYLSSEEQIIESINANEYTFEADGTIRNV